MRYRRILALTLSATIVGGAAAAPALAQDKGGGDQPSVTLSLAVWDQPGDETEQVALDLIALAPAISAGSITIAAPRWGARDAADLVRTGQVDLAILPTRDWSALGVTSLDALEAPFLIDNDALALAVATSDIAADAMAGLDAEGVTGLALWPEDLRHLFAFKTSGRTFVTPADFAGSLVDVRAGKVGRGLITTLGGAIYEEGVETSGQSGDYVIDAQSGVLAGRVGGLHDATLDYEMLEPTVVAGDVVLFPKYQVLVAGDASLEKLSDEQQGYLDETVTQVHTAALARQQSEVELAANACMRGGTVIEAGDAALSELRAAAQPLMDALLADPVTGDLVARIRELAGRTISSAPAAPCRQIDGPPAGTTEGDLAVASPPEIEGYTGTELLPDGTYRAELDADQLEAAGMPRHLAVPNAAVWTLTIDGGRWELSQPRPERCSGVQEVLGDFVRTTTTVSQGCGMDADLRWRLDESGLWLRVVGLAWSSEPGIVAQENAWYDRVWTRID
jgi:TRAP-type C4-dicarboxylate transport system substrate-binding protein